MAISNDKQALILEFFNTDYASYLGYCGYNSEDIIDYCYRMKKRLSSAEDEIEFRKLWITKDIITNFPELDNFLDIERTDQHENR